MIYRIGKDVEFDEKKATLTNLTLDHTVNLDNLEAQTLSELLNDQGSYIAYNQFFKHWKSKEVSDASLSRVISLLRKHFKSIGITQVEIKNKTKTGYMLVTDLEIKTVLNSAIEPTSSSPKPVTNITFIQHTPKAVYLLILMTFITAIFLINSSPEANEENESYTYVQLFEDLEKKSNLSFNYAMTHYAYVSVLKNSPVQIIIRDKTTNQALRIGHDKWNYYAPTWLSDDTLIYQTATDQKCFITQMEFNTDLTVKSERNIANCNVDTIAPVIAKLTDELILYKDAIRGSAQSTFLTLNISTGQVQEVTELNSQAEGVYVLKSTTDSPLVAMLRSNQFGGRSEVSIYDSSQNWEKVFHKSFNYVLRNIGWESDKLTYANQQGGYTSLKIINGNIVSERKQTVLTNVLEITQSQGNLVFFSGYARKGEILELSLDGDYKQGFKSTSNLNHAKYYNDNIIFYVSEDTGLPQIRAMNTESGNDWQISHFKTLKKIKALAVNNNTLVLESKDQLDIYELSSSLTTLQLRKTIDGRFPSVSSDELIYSKAGENGFDLYITDLVSLKERLLVKGGKHSQFWNEELYFSFQSKLGIFKYQSHENHELIFAQDEVYNKWLFNGYELYYQKKYEKSVYHQYLGEETASILSRTDTRISDVNLNALLTVKFTPGKTKAVTIINN